MSYFHWIAGCGLALAWIWRLADAALGVPRVADISRPEWDRNPPGNPRISIIVPARNEAADIEATLVQLLALDYSNYEVIAVDDRSSDRTGEIMEESCCAIRQSQGGADHPVAGRLDGQASRHVERRLAGHRRLAAVYRCRCVVQAGCCPPRPGLRRS